MHLAILTFKPLIQKKVNGPLHPPVSRYNHNLPMPLAYKKLCLQEIRVKSTHPAACGLADRCVHMYASREAENVSDRYTVCWGNNTL